MSSANSLEFETKLSDNLFRYIEKSNGPRNRTWGSPA